MGGHLFSIGWFKRLFSKEQGQHTKLDGISTSIEALNGTISSNGSVIQKGFRRLSMAQKQQSDAIALLSQESSSIKFALAQAKGLSLTYEQILHLLDGLARVNHAANNAADPREIIAPLVLRMIEDLLSLFELTGVAEVGKPYPEQGCEVVGAADTLESPQWPPGTITEILLQGYQTTAGNLVRTAKVIASREVSTVQTNKQCEDSGHVDG